MSELAITDAEFGRFRALMRRVAGVELAATKKHLVSGRLGRRLRAHGLQSFGDYFRLVVGGTADLVRKVKKLGARSEIINTKELFGL